MKEKILAFLKQRMAGAQESFLLGVAENYSKTIASEDQIETVISDGVIQSLKFSAQFAQTEGDRRANEAQKTAVKNFREKFKLDENGKPVSDPIPPKQPGGGGNEIPDWAKSIQETVTQLAGTVQTVVSTQTTAQKKSEARALFDKAATKLPEKWFDRIDVNLETPIDEQLKTLTDEYTELRQTVIDSEVEKGNYTPNEGGEASDSDMEAYLNETFGSSSQG